MLGCMVMVARICMVVVARIHMVVVAKIHMVMFTCRSTRSSARNSPRTKQQL